MILFDCDNLGRHCDLLFFFFFSRRFPRLAVDSPIYASNKHFVTSQFILIAPLCQPTALMILRRTLHSVPRCRAFVFSPTARRRNLVGWSNCFSSARSHGYTVCFEDVLGWEQRTPGCFIFCFLLSFQVPFPLGPGPVLLCVYLKIP